MTKQKVLAWVIGVSQFALAFAFLVIPEAFFEAFGFTSPTPDQKYLYGQLAARFLAYGFGMIYIARHLAGNRFWWDMMALIQGIDLGVAIVYTLAFGVALQSTAFPMFNAAVFLILLLAWRPHSVDRDASVPQ